MNITSPRVEALAQRLAQVTGEDIETAIERAIEERLSRAVPPLARHRAAATNKYLAGIKALPVLDSRSPDELIGYGPDGLPG